MDRLAEIKVQLASGYYGEYDLEDFVWLIEQVENMQDTITAQEVYRTGDILTISIQSVLIERMQSVVDAAREVENVGYKLSMMPADYKKFRDLSKALQELDAKG